jgi:glycosyltransferase involved in cell wall biosynthesis
MQSPIFSVIIPVHNRVNTIKDCLDSILAQNFKDYEIIVVDNNSTDDLAGFMRSYDDPRVIFTSCKIPGPSAARMHGVSLSKGTYLSFIDSDDLWQTDVLEQVHSFLESERHPIAVYLSTVIFRSDLPINWSPLPPGGVVVAANLLDAMWYGIAGACALAGVRRELFENGQGFAEEIWVGEDVDWALRHASAGPVILLYDQPRLGYRRHEENITKDSTRYMAWALQLLLFARTGRYATSANQNLRKYIVSHLMGQLQMLLRMRCFRSFFRIYPRVVALGIQWRVFCPLFMPSFFQAYFSKKTGLSTGA